jgi:hypothetical protein
MYETQIQCCCPAKADTLVSLKLDRATQIQLMSYSMEAEKETCKVFRHMQSRVSKGKQS